MLKASRLRGFSNDVEYKGSEEKRFRSKSGMSNKKKKPRRPAEEVRKRRKPEEQEREVERRRRKPEENEEVDDEVKKQRRRKKKKRREVEKVRELKRPINLNMGYLVFFALFVYIIVLIVSYTRSEHIVPYEVTMGSLAINNTYKGVALRDEVLVTADYSGYVNYYAREGEKVSNGSMVYTIDSTGKLSDMVSDNTSNDNKLTDEDLYELKSDISDFSNSFNPHEFASTYNFKYDIEGTVLKLENYRVLTGIDKLNAQNYSDAVSFGYAPDSGVLVYACDGYEGLTAEELTPAHMDEAQYVRSQFHSGDLIGEGDNAYKLITKEDWSVVIEIDEERALELANESYVEVRFLKNNYKSWGKISILHQNGSVYLKLDFNNSMITFASDRFIELELLLNTQTGLKIPNSAIVERAFYLIPQDYYTEGGALGNAGFIRECYLEDGTKSTEFVDASVYALVDGYYYVDEGTFNIGDRLIRPESEDVTTVSRQDTLTGVYNINKGYADFKEIEVLSRNDEYSIVKSHSEYGLNVYDHIVLKGDTVSDRDFIYE